jgi:integrase
MSKPATGELVKLRAGGFAARVRIEGTRKEFHLPTCATEAEARARCSAMASIASQLGKAGHGATLPKLLAMGAEAPAGKPWEAVVAAARSLCAGTAEPLGAKPVTFADFAADWTKGRLHAKYPDQVGKKKEPEADERLLSKYVLPHVGHVAIASFTLEHADEAMSHVPEGMSSSLRRHVAQVIRRVMALAVYPGRLRNDNPIPSGWLPKVRRERALTYLYPSEEAALLACTAVPLWRRIFYGVLAREGMRREELAALRWRDVDLERGVLSLDENKTDDPRAWSMRADVTATLAWWKAQTPDAHGSDYVFGGSGRVYTNKLAEAFRADLVTAGIKREQLFERTATRRPIRIHDLRATFVTVNLANGKTEAWVCDRTGHRSSAMVAKYRRGARTWSEMALGELADLYVCTPETSTVRPMNARRAPKDGEACDQESPEISSGEIGIRTLGRLAPTLDFQSNRGPHENQASTIAPACEVADCTESPLNDLNDGQSVGQVEQYSGGLDVALAEALRGATAAGRWDVVAQLAREIEARRLATMPNVHVLAAKKKAT